VFAVFMRMIRRCCAFLVVHDPGQHVIGFCQLLADKEDALASRHF
jgi:hypothetical protein